MRLVPLVALLVACRQGPGHCYQIGPFYGDFLVHSPSFAEMEALYLRGAEVTLNSRQLIITYTRDGVTYEATWTRRPDPLP